MKLGILTYHNIPNIGAILQAYSLCQALNDRGVPTEIVDYQCKNLIQRELAFHPHKNPLKNIIFRRFVWPRTQDRIHGCLEFMRAQHCYSPQQYDRQTISQANNRYDGFISGADMIWNRDINGYDDTFFLDFVAPGKKKYAYGSSIGGTWKTAELPHIKNLLSQYNFLSVREEDTARFINDHFHLPVQWVADPTMLLTPNHWKQFTSPVKEKEYVLVYFHYKDVLRAARQYAKQHHKKLLVINSGLPKWGIRSIVVSTPQQWLSYIRYADAVFTDSYHGLLFSLYFEKPVWTHNSSNRLQSILKKLGITHRFIPNDKTLSSTIDYTQVTPRVDAFRTESIQFLEKIAADFGRPVRAGITAFKTTMHCSGCTACQAICPKQAITMRPDEEGFLRPLINQALCVHCNLCRTVCPAEKPTELLTSTYQPRTFAARYKDNSVRFRSASGAFFPAIAKHFLKQGAYVCGCVLDAHMHPIHIVTNQWADVERMQDSKYVQSDMRNCFDEIATLLKKQTPVLFTGTSCQVAGLKLFLKTAKISDEKLFSVDFFCHGVPSPKIWHEYLAFYSRVKKRMILKFRFRNKTWGWGTGKGTYHVNTLETAKWGEPSSSSIRSVWRSIFFSNLCLRPYCGTCPYTTIYKPADITMGDFWGIEQVLPSFNDGKGSSVLLAHCDKAVNLLSQIEGLTIAEVNTQAAVERQANAVAPSPVSPNRRQFWQDYHVKGFDYVMRQYFYYTPYHRLKRLVKYMLFKVGLWKTPF